MMTEREDKLEDLAYAINALYVAPSSQGPCICPAGGIVWDCPRCAYVKDYVGGNPFKDHLRELRRR